MSCQDCRSGGRGCADLPSRRQGCRDRCRGRNGPAAQGQGGTVAVCRHSGLDQGSLRHKGAGDPRRFARAGGFRAGGGRRAGGGAVARGRLRCDRPHQHDRIRLFRHRHQSAFRHAEECLQSQRRACARRFVVGCRGIDRRRHGVWRARHRYRRLLPDSGGLQRHRRLQADASPYSARRRRAAVVLARQLRPAWRARSPAARRSMPCSPTSPCSRCSRAP